jgi:hypothetical protein
MELDTKTGRMTVGHNVTLTWSYRLRLEGRQ